MKYLDLKKTRHSRIKCRSICKENQKGKMMYIVELETKNGRIFKVAINNKSQEARLRNVIRKNESKRYETFVRIDENKLNGIHNIKQFEALSNELV